MQTAFIGIPVAPGIARVVLFDNADEIRANLKSLEEVEVVLNTPKAGYPHRITPNSFEIEVADPTNCPKFLFVNGGWVEVVVTKEEPENQ